MNAIKAIAERPGLLGLCQDFIRFYPLGSSYVAASHGLCRERFLSFLFVMLEQQQQEHIPTIIRLSELPSEP